MGKLNTIKNEEYEITDLIYNYQMENLTKEQKAYVLQHNAKIFKKRKAYFYRTMRKYGYPISNKTTHQLMELGEINLNQAVELEFYCSLSKADRCMYREQCYSIYDAAMDEYINKCFNLNRYLLSMKRCSILSRSYLEQAQQFNLPTHLEFKDILLDIAGPTMLWNDKMRLSNTYFAAWKSLEEHYQQESGESIAETRENLKKLSKKAITQANNLRNFDLADGLDDDLMLVETLTHLRSALSNDAKQMLRKNLQMQKKFIRASEAEKNRFL